MTEMEAYLRAGGIMIGMYVRTDCTVQYSTDVELSSVKCLWLVLINKQSRHDDRHGRIQVGLSD